MERSQAINKQLRQQRNIYMTTPSLYHFMLPWLMICIFGGFLGALLYFNVQPLTTRQWVENNGLSFISGWKFYIDNCLIFFWIYKAVSMIQILKKETAWDSYKLSILRDTFATLAFLLSYNAIEYISRRYTVVQMSGHALVLLIESSMVLFEAETNFRLTFNETVFFIGKGIIAYNYYIFLWTCVIYHKFSDTLLGITVGMLISYYIYFRMDKVKIK